MKKKRQQSTMIQGMNEPLRALIQDMTMDELRTIEGQQLVDKLTQPLGNSLLLMEALLMIPGEEVQSLLKKNDVTLQKLFMLLSSAFFHVRVAYEAGSQQAAQIVKKINQKLETAAATMPVTLLNMVLASADEAELAINETIVAIVRDRFGEDYEGMDEQDALFADGLPTPAEFVRQMLDALPDDATYHELYSMMLEFFGNRLPEEAAKMLIMALLLGNDETTQGAALLFILHPDKMLRAQTAEALIDVYDKLELSEDNLSRLYQLIYWLPDAEREPLSQALSLTLDFPPTKPTKERSLLRVQGNFCDGAGCFASTLLVKTGDTIHLINVLCKENAGVKDCILVSHFDELEEAEAMFDDIIDSLEDQGMLTGKVPLSALLPQWEHFIAVGHNQSRPPAATLVAVAEILNETYWLPERLASESLARKFLSSYVPHDKGAARKRSTAWCTPTHDMRLWSWFETNAALHKLVTRAKRQKLSPSKLYDKILADIILPDRQRWLERFLLCGLLMEAMEHDEFITEALPDFAVLIEDALLDSTFVAHPLMRRVAELSARSSQEREKVEGSMLEVMH